MTAHVSKEQLALMLPGTMSHYDASEPEYLEAPRPGLLARLFEAASSWAARHETIQEVSALSDSQLADIGISRGDVPLVCKAGFDTRRDHDRLLAALQAGRIAGM